MRSAEYKLNDVSNSVDVFYIELSQLKKDLEKYISIKTKYISRVLFFIKKPFFKRNCYNRFKDLLAKQSDFKRWFSAIKAASFDTESLYKTLGIFIKITECVNLTSQTLQIQSEIDLLLPKANFKYYDFIFTEIDKYVQESSIYSKTTSKDDFSNRTFENYRDILQDSINIIYLLKELSELNKKCNILKASN